MKTALEGTCFLLAWDSSAGLPAHLVTMRTQESRAELPLSPYGNHALPQVSSPSHPTEFCFVPKHVKIHWPSSPSMSLYRLSLLGEANHQIMWIYMFIHSSPPREVGRLLSQKVTRGTETLYNLQKGTAYKGKSSDSNIDGLALESILSAVL